MGYDCILILQGEVKKTACRNVERDDLKKYYIGYFITLGNDDIKCTMRKTHNQPPVSKDRYRIKGMKDNLGYVNNIMNTLHEINKYPLHKDFSMEYKGVVFTLHSLEMKKGIKEFMEQADVLRALLTIKHGGV